MPPFAAPPQGSNLATLLQWLGYLLPSDIGNPLKVAVAIVQYLLRHGLPPTSPDAPADAMRHILTTPRCALPDVQPARPSLCRWEKSTLRVFPGNAPSSVLASRWETVWIKGLAPWEAVCGIDFTLVGSRAEADIWATSQRIDGPGSILAWSEMPCGAGGRPLEQRYDAADRWDQYGDDYLAAVITHEVGHAIGFDHSSSNSDIMWPTMRSGKYTLGPGDIAGAVQRYGPATNPPVPPVPDPIPIPIPPGPGPDPIPPPPQPWEWPITRDQVVAEWEMDSSKFDTPLKGIPLRGLIIVDGSRRPK